MGDSTCKKAAKAGLAAASDRPSACPVRQLHRGAPPSRLQFGTRIFRRGRQDVSNFGFDGAPRKPQTSLFPFFSTRDPAPAFLKGSMGRPASCFFLPPEAKRSTATSTMQILVRGWWGLVRNGCGGSQSYSRIQINDLNIGEKKVVSPFCKSRYPALRANVWVKIIERSRDIKEIHHL